MSSPVLEVSSLSVTYGRRTILDKLSLTVHKGEAVAVTGRTGSGKSTLLSCVSGLLRTRRGNVRLAGEDLTTMRASRLAAHRRHTLGILFQDGELLPSLAPLENVILPALLAGEDRAAAEARGRELLERLGVPDTGDTSATLSGGERQRAALARALINGPHLVIADEPTASLDTRTSAEVTALILDQARSEGCGVLLVTHDPSVAAGADRSLELVDGRLVPTASTS